MKALACRDDLEGRHAERSLRRRSRRGDLRPEENIPRGTGAATRRFASEILPLLGPQARYATPDVSTDSQTMAWIMDTYSSMTGSVAPGVVTGKPVSLGGSEAHGDAAARGCLVAVEEACKVKRMSLRGATIAIQGYGSVGSSAARLLAEKKAQSSPSAIRAAAFTIRAGSTR